MSTCRSCPAFEALGETCRREAPRINLLPGPDGGPIVVLWPRVKPTAWCMHHPERQQRNGAASLLALADHPPDRKS